MRFRTWLTSLLALTSFSVLAQTTDTAAVASAKPTTTATVAKPEATMPATTTNSLLATPSDRISYAIGADIGQNFKSQNLILSPTALAAGVSDVMNNKPLQMSAQERQETLVNFQKDLISKRQAKITALATNNKITGEAFLTANKTKPGVETLADGLQYKIIKAGEGNSPTNTDLVTVNYSGSLIDGQVFDSSYKRGKPMTFPVNEVIPGWTEALKMMKPGAIWEIYVPPALAYGERGIGPIGPNQTLIFKIELIAVTPPNTKAASANSAVPKTGGATN